MQTEKLNSFIFLFTYIIFFCQPYRLTLIEVDCLPITLKNNTFCWRTFVYGHLFTKLSHLSDQVISLKHFYIILCIYKMGTSYLYLGIMNIVHVCEKLENGWINFLRIYVILVLGIFGASLFFYYLLENLNTKYLINTNRLMLKGKRNKWLRYLLIKVKQYIQ